jgi:DNA-3-methyladenine glycosylase II
MMSLTVVVVPPFRLDFTVLALQRREKNIVDQWDGIRYTRVLVYGNDTIKMTATQGGAYKNPRVIITLDGKADLKSEMEQDIKLLVQKVLGLNVNLQQFYTCAESSEVIAPLVKHFLGVKPPRFPSLFEALVNAIACQQVSLDAAIQILNRFSERFGMQFDDGKTISYGFPRPEDLMSFSEEDIKAVGFSRQKACSIKALAIGVQNHSIDFSCIDGMTNEGIADYLSTIRGIGRWSIEYVLLRGLGRLDMFPGDDIGAQNNLQRLFHLEKKPDYEQIKRLTSQWMPYQGLVYFHLLLDKLRAKGVI